MIQIKNISKKYGSYMAVNHISFDVQPGEVLGFLGPNGAGKTTTMKMLTGFMPPSEGQIIIDGLDVFESPIEVKKRIGYLPETPPLYLDMSVQEYLEFAARLKLVENNKIKERVEYVIEQMDLKDVRKKLILYLSKGFKQRVGIAQALVSDPKVLILDEPTVGLDPKQMVEIRALILKLKGQHTIILSTHILSEVQAVCERVVILNKGQIVSNASVESLTAQAKNLTRKILLRVSRPSETLFEQLRKIEGVQSLLLSHGGSLSLDCLGPESIQERLAQCVVESGAGLLEITPSSQNLENIFIQLTS